MCLIDGRVITVEVNTYKCINYERLIFEVHGESRLGAVYSEAFESLFDQARPINTSEEIQETIDAWYRLKTPTVAHSFLSLIRSQTDNRQFENLKLFAHSKQVCQWLQGEVPTPITLELDLTLTCNDRCPRCTYGFAHQERTLTFEQIRALLEEASALGIRGLTITGGGDPLMHPEADKIFRAARDCGFFSGLFTNGGQIQTEALAEQMVKNLNWVRVSVDSASEKHFCEVRGYEGYQRRLKSLTLLAKVRVAKAYGECDLGISFLTSSDTKEDIVKAAKMAKDLGYDYIQFKPMIKWSKNSHHGSKALQQQMVFDELHKALELQDSTFKILFSREKYESEILEGAARRYSAFHCAWFVFSVGPSLRGTPVNPTLYLDCSSKYLDKWTIGEFDKLSHVLSSEGRRELISKTSSDFYCVPAEKHAIYNHQLEMVRLKHSQAPITEEAIGKMVPPNVAHKYSL